MIVVHSVVLSVISIHALRKEGDVIFVVRDVRDAGFLSTPSARRATDNMLICFDTRIISIHALRKEGDRPTQPPVT